MADKGFLASFEAVFNRVVDGLTYVAVGLLVPMMFLVTADVIGRYLLNSPIPAVFEINSYFLMVLVVFFPLAYVDRHKEHVFVTLFTDRLGAKTRAVLETVSLVIGIAAYSLIGWYGLQRAIMSTEVREYISGIIDVPIWLAKWIIPIGCLVFVIELALDAVKHVRFIAGREEA